MDYFRSRLDHSQALLTYRYRYIGVHYQRINDIVNGYSLNICAGSDQPMIPGRAAGSARMRSAPACNSSRRRFSGSAEEKIAPTPR